MMCLTFLSTQAQWLNLPSGVSLDLNDVCFTSTTTGYVVGGNGYVMKTSNSGTTWIDKTFSTLPFAQRPWLHDITFTSASTGYTVGGGCWKTTDAGDTWTEQTTNWTTSALFSVDFPDANTGYMVGGSENIIKTKNGGANWVLKHTGSAELHGVSFADTSHGWAVGYGKVLHTMDGGNTWATQYTASENYWHCVAIDNNTCYVCGSSGQILKTINGGANWTIQSTGTLSDILQMYFINSTTGYATGGQSTILFTNDGGITWVPQYCAVSFGIFFGVCFTDLINGYICGGSGVMLKTTNGGITGIEDVSGDNNFTLFPNPASDLITIYPSEDFIGKQILIFNSIGKCVRNEEISSDQISLKELPEGVYFIAVSGDYKNKLRLIILR